MKNQLSSFLIRLPRLQERWELHKSIRIPSLSMKSHSSSRHNELVPYIHIMITRIRTKKFHACIQFGQWHPTSKRVRPKSLVYRFYSHTNYVYLIALQYIIDKSLCCDIVFALFIFFLDGFWFIVPSFPAIIILIHCSKKKKQ